MTEEDARSKPAPAETAPAVTVMDVARAAGVSVSTVSRIVNGTARVADDKRRARLNCIAHLLGKVPYEAIHYEPITLPPIKTEGYERPPLTSQTFVPDITADLEA